MQLLSWADPWFQRTVPVLLAACFALTVAWGVLAYTVEPEAAEPAPHSAPQQDAVPPSQQRITPTKAPTISPQKGRVGNVKLGMTRKQAGAALNEELVPLQAPTAGSGQFEVAAPKAGLRLTGRYGKIDTIVITSVGKGPTYKTSRNVGIGSPIRTVRRVYAESREMCENEWWFDTSGKTFKFTGAKKVAQMTLTSVPSNDLVYCP